MWTIDNSRLIPQPPVYSGRFAFSRGVRCARRAGVGGPPTASARLALPLTMELRCVDSSYISPIPSLSPNSISAYHGVAGLNRGCRRSRAEATQFLPALHLVLAARLGPDPDLAGRGVFALPHDYSDADRILDVRQGAGPPYPPQVECDVTPPQSNRAPSALWSSTRGLCFAGESVHLMQKFKVKLSLIALTTPMFSAILSLVAIAVTEAASSKPGNLDSTRRTGVGGGTKKETRHRRQPAAGQNKEGLYDHYTAVPDRCQDHPIQR